jgi:hypothetical protein
MPRRLSSIQVWLASRTAQISPPGGVAYLDSVDGDIQVTHELGRAAQLLLRLVPGCPAATDPALFTRREIIRLVYDDASFEEFRVLRFERNLSGGGAVLTGEHIVADLSSRVVRRNYTDGAVLLSVPFTGLTTAHALTALMDPTSNAPSLFVAGTVDAAYSAVTVDVHATGDTTHLDIIEALCAQIGAEWEAVYNNGSGKYQINIVQEAGWNAAERSAGTPNPARRPIQFGAQTQCNRRNMKRLSDREDFFSRIIPLGGSGEELVHVGEAFWPVTAATYSSSTGRTTLTVGGTPIWVSGALAGLYFGMNGGTFYPIHSTTAPSTVVVTGNATALVQGRFATDAIGTELTYLEDVVAVGEAGVVERVERMAHVVPFSNLLAEAGVSADLSDWSGGLPVGIEAVSVVVGGTTYNPTVTQESDVKYVRYGTTSAEVLCPKAGCGLRTISIPVAALTHERLSIWVTVRVSAGGKVRLVLVDANGVVQPAATEQQQAVSTSDSLEAIAVGGLVPSTGPYRLQVTAEVDNTTFWLDAWTLTNTGSPVEYAPEMGPPALWRAAAKRLLDEGGMLPIFYEGRLFDLSHVDSVAFDEIRPGSHVEVKDGYDPADGTFSVEFTARVAKVVESENRVTGRIRKEVELSRRQAGFKDLFRPSDTRSKTPLQIILGNGSLAIDLSVAVVSESGDTITVQYDATILVGLGLQYSLRYKVGSGVDVQAAMFSASSAGVFVVNKASVATEVQVWVQTVANVPLAVSAKRSLLMARQAPSVTLTILGEGTDAIGYYVNLQWALSYIPAEPGWYFLAEDLNDVYRVGSPAGDEGAQIDIQVSLPWGMLQVPQIKFYNEVGAYGLFEFRLYNPDGVLMRTATKTNQ